MAKQFKIYSFRRTEPTGEVNNFYYDNYRDMLMNLQATDTLNHFTVTPTKQGIISMLQRLNAKIPLPEKLTETFKVVTVSKNTNSFGLYGVIILSQSGKAFEIGMGSINEPKKDQLYVCELTQDGNLINILNKSFEIPRKLPKAPSEVITQVWGTIKQHA